MQRPKDERPWAAVWLGAGAVAVGEVVGPGLGWGQQGG